MVHFQRQRTKRHLHGWCWGIATVLAVTAALGSGVGASAATEIDPATGPAAGGTQVTVPDVTFTFAAVSPGDFHSAALDSNGNAYAWGYNGFGQLGNGTTTSSDVPVAVTMPPGVTFTSIYAAGVYTVALDSNGNAYTWGFNSNGQLGDGTETDSSVPVPVTMPAGVTFTSVKAGGNYSLALASDGNAYAWGYNGFGGLGDGTTTASSIPVAVTMPAGVTFTSVSTGSAHSVALGSDGNAYAWGFNSDGQLGDGTTTASSIPLAVPAQLAVTSVTFDGTAGTGLAQNPDGTWSVTTPNHAAGAVDVVVEWTLNGIAQNPITHTGAFTFMGADESDGSGTDGDGGGTGGEGSGGSGSGTTGGGTTGNGTDVLALTGATPYVALIAGTLSIALTAAGMLLVINRKRNRGSALEPENH